MGLHESPGLRGDGWIAQIPPEIGSDILGAHIGRQGARKTERGQGGVVESRGGVPIDNADLGRRCSTGCAIEEIPERAIATLRNGRHERSVTHVPGDPARPFGEADLRKKFHKLVASVPEDQVDDMFTRARRYFRADEAEQLKRIFLSHYTGEGTRIQTQVHERTGIWIVREALVGQV